MTLQLFVEKKKEFDTVATRMLQIIRKSDKLNTVTDLRIFKKYTIENIPPQKTEYISRHILSDPYTDNLFIDFLPITTEYLHFTVESPNNQNNIEQQNILNALKLNGCNNCGVSASTVYAIGKGVKENTLAEIKSMLVTDGLEIIAENKADLKIEKPKDIKKDYIEGFTKMNDIDIYQYHRKHRIRMPSQDLCKLRDYYKSIDRDPLRLEIAVIDSCWSDIQRETETVLEKIEIKDSPLNLPVQIALDEYLSTRKSLYGDRKVPVTFKDLSSIGFMALKQKGQASDIERLPDGKMQIQIPVDIDGVYEQWILTFKASKCGSDKGFDYFAESVGNHFKDRTSPYQSIHLNCIGHDNVKLNKSIVKENKQKKTESQYLSRCQVATREHKTVIANSESMHIEFAASVAASPKTNMQKTNENVNDTIIMLGGKIGNKDLPKNEIIQKNNGIIKEKIQQLLRNSNTALIIKRCCSLNQGLIPAIYSITDDGVIIDIDRIVENDSVDISKAVSVPNERVIVLCDKYNAERFMKLAHSIGLSANNIAITDEKQSFRFLSKSKQVMSVDRKLLSYKGEFQKSNVVISAPDIDFFTRLPDDFYKLKPYEAFLKNLSINNYNDNSQADVNFDWAAGAATVLSPYGGKYQSTPEEAFVCKIPSGNKNTNTVTITSFGATPKITAVSSFHGAAFSIMEALSKIVASGGNSLDVKLALCEHFVDPATAPTKWSEPIGALLGAFEAQMSMGLASIDNAVSIEPVGNFKTAFAFAAFAVANSKTNNIISAEFKEPDSTVLLIPMPTVPKTKMPDFDRAKIMYRQFHYLSQSSKVISASVVKTGGVANAVAKMSFGNGIGVNFKTTDFDTLFGENTASIIVETKNPAAFSGMNTVVIGKTIDSDCFLINDMEVKISTALGLYRNSTEKPAVKAHLPKVKAPTQIMPYSQRTLKHSFDKRVRPNVLLPLFSHEFGAVSMDRAFTNSGGRVNSFVYDFKHIDESKNKLTSLITNSQIIALPPGNTSSSAVSLTVLALSDPMVYSAIQTFLLNGGLILGIGSGFDTLLKLGLFGISSDNATFAPNINSNTVSTLSRTSIVSLKSPWFNNCELGEINTVNVFGDKLRFVADDATLSLLSANGNIATQFIDLNSEPTTKIPYNPVGSSWAIEGITSPNGAVLGKIAISDRYTENCFINVPGKKDQGLFKSGIEYFM